MFEVNNKDTKTTVSIVNFEHAIVGWEDYNILHNLKALLILPYGKILTIL